MRLTKLHVTGFRSLADVSLVPTPFTVFAGPNNAGKSNIVDSIQFLSDIYRDGLRSALDSRGGFENLVHRRGKSSVAEITFAVEASLLPDEMDENSELTFPEYLLQSAREQLGLPNATIILRHSFSIKGFKARGSGTSLRYRVRVQNESIELLISDDALQDQEELYRFEVKGRNKRPIQRWNKARKDVKDLLSMITVQLDSTNFLTDFLRQSKDYTRHDVSIRRLSSLLPILDVYTSSFGRSQVYRLSPHECRKPSAPTPDALLGIHGEDLPSVVHHLKHNHPVQWERVQRRLSSILVSFQDVDVVSTPDRLWSIRFVETSGSQWSANDVSDGTIRSLALFTALYDPRTTLISIEEPENTFHPWMLRRFIDSADEIVDADQSKQVLISTHSPVVLDEIQQSQLVIVWSQDGSTRVATINSIDPEIAEALDAGDIFASDVLDSGLILQSIPGAPG